jgi:hypothetical protein
VKPNGCCDEMNLASCHGAVIHEQSGAIVASFYKGYHMYKGFHYFLDQYYNEIMPIFNEQFLIPYKEGDKCIVVDPDGPGNLAIMAMIASRQPWEYPNAIHRYIGYREKYQPLISLYLMHYHKKYNGNQQIGSFYQDHDVFCSNIDVAQFAHFVTSLEFDPEKERDSFNEGNKEGVFDTFQLSEGTNPIHAHAVKKHRQGAVIQKGFLGREMTIYPTNQEEFLSIVDETFEEHLPKELIYAEST